MTSVWTIQLLGGLSARHHDEVLTRFASQKTAALLAFLACYRDNAHSRETLIELLWPEVLPSAGRTRLNTLLTFLRHHLEPPGVPAGAVVQADRVHVRLNPDTLTTDVARFSALLQRARQAPEGEARLAWLQQAIEVYRGDLLPGWFEEWVLGEQARLKEAYAQALHEWAEGLQQTRALEAALAASRQALAVDPYREPTCRLQMQLFTALDQPGAALQVYRSFAQRLHAELGVAPSALTRMLAEQIQRNPQTVVRMSETMSAPRTPVSSLVVTARSAGESEAAAPMAAEINTPLPLSLPLQLTRFFGREALMVSLRDLLTHSEPRLITLTGPGGVGKTRLAIEAARGLGAVFEGRVWFVDLASLQDGRLLPFALVSALHLTLTPQSDPLEQVVQQLQHGPSLLLLDNFEHLLGKESTGAKSEGAFEGGGSALLVRLLLERAPELKVLVTSRQPLHLGGEQEMSVPALPMPENQGRGKKAFGVGRLALGVKNPADEIDGKREEGGEYPNTPIPRYLDTQIPNAQRLTPNAMLSFPSVALYVDRARAARPDFALTENNTDVVAELCRKLEGMPLALEMAAAWAKTMPPAGMLERLEQQLDLLVSRRRDVPARQRSMRATLEWGFNLLDPSLQKVFARLSVFRGGWTLEAAEQVCATDEGAGSEDQGVGSREWGVGKANAVDTGSDSRERRRPNNLLPTPYSLLPSSVLGLLSELADQSLVVVEETGRYRLLASVREYAEEKLEESGERPAVQRRHADYFLALAEEANPKLQGVEQAQWLARLTVEHDNLRAALAEYRAAEDGAETGLRLAAALWPFWQIRGHLNEGRARFAGVLGRDGAGGRTQARASALSGASGLALIQGDYATVRSLLEEALALQRELGDRRGVAHSLLNMGSAAYFQDDYAAARSLYEQSLAILKELEDRSGVAGSLLNLGMVVYSQGNYEAARSLFEESLAIGREVGDERGIAHALFHLGNVANEQGDYAVAGAIYEQSLTILQELGDRRGVSHSLINLGNVAYRQDDYATARSHFEQGLEIVQQLGIKPGIASSLEGFAKLAGVEGRRKRAARLWGATDALREVIGEVLPPGGRAEYDRHIAILREGLGEETFKEAYSLGRAMTLEQAIAYALEDTVA